MRKLQYLFYVILLISLAVGCSKENAQKTTSPVANSSDDPVFKRILKEGYAPSDIEELPDRYIVQHDIIFYKKEPGQNANGATTEQARSPYLVAPAYRHINVYLDGSFSSINLSGILDNVIAAYNAVGSGIQMSRVYSSASANITITQNSLQLGICGQAGFPFSNGQPFNVVYISEYTLNYYGLTSTAQLTLLLAHELGHCVGLRHTNWQPQGESSAIHIPSTPATDGSSIMNGGTCGVNWGGFSYYDQIALLSLYPVTLGGPNNLQAGQQLSQGQLIRSSDGRFILVMQGDGNLVLYYYNVPLWDSGTYGNSSINRAVMQGDGNFVLYDTNNAAHWDSGTYNYPGGYVVLQDDGNLVIYQNGVARWDSNTWGY
ncbi:D-mannose binding lectin [Chitinophaga sp. CF118]|uniref:M57 family metalloprotease n=1 Tax=Chitinophaga sp. CF118 TaxID=1884367 RepID=UPI0008E81746|nr:M57 family metalloprotease [Chitinophaga sp. CF118]SFD99383.1 D-mannose binding lectin [Chitinophaga sp. CF118]